MQSKWCYSLWLSPCCLTELGSREVDSKIGRILLIYIYFYFFSFFQSQSHLMNTGFARSSFKGKRRGKELIDMGNCKLWTFCIDWNVLTIARQAAESVGVKNSLVQWGKGWIHNKIKTWSQNHGCFFCRNSGWHYLEFNKDYVTRGEKTVPLRSVNTLTH